MLATESEPSYLANARFGLAVRLSAKRKGLPVRRIPTLALKFTLRPDPLMTKTPASLLERLRGQFEPDAWGQFVSLYAPLIYGWGRRVGLQEQDAADLVQDVFVTLLQVLPTFTYDRHQSFRRWLWTVTINKWRKARHQPDNRVWRGLAGGPEPVAVDDGLQEAWEAENQRHLANQALRLMRADFEETTWKACWEVVAVGRPAAAVAAELGLSVGAVYVAKFRVLKRLRRDLQGLLD
jgi:RNA polymerase sigma-70 factor (ECF subfamily)